ncbi:MAG TPA: AAA family ATPase [Verrucomicrobiae bacterium]
MSDKFKRFLPVLIVAFVAALVLLWQPNPKAPVEEIGRAKLERLMEQKAISSANLTPKAYKDIYEVKGTYQRGMTSPKVDFSITTHLTEGQIQALLDRPNSGVQVPTASVKSRFIEHAGTLIVASLVICLLIYHTNIGRSKGTHKVRQRPSIRFADVAGIEEAKSEVQEVIDFLRDPAKYKKLGGNLPKGILLIGPPGTGKTMLARAMAGEANAHFFSASGSDFNEMYVGVGAKRVRDLFRQARSQKPAIIFIDEIDCLGKNRKTDQNGEMQQTNNALLTEMDGFDSSEGVIVVAATNRPEDLDEALLRPGRFDRKVFVPLPDAKGRRAILQSHGRKAPIHAPEYALQVLAQTTVGMSGAELANVINEAAIISAQKKNTHISLTELEEARDKVRFGKERRSMILQADERRVVAYHEAGHAVVHLQMTQLPELHKVSIIPRGQALGTTTTMPREDQNIHSRKFLVEQLAVLMGGRAAENIFIGDMTNGANGDLDSAKNIARKMIHDWGMGKKLYYEPSRDDAEREINSLLEDAMKTAHEIMHKFRKETELLAEKLLTDETLTREEVLQLFGQSPAEESGSSDPTSATSELAAA